MSEVQMEFEPTRSFGYRFTRYGVLPEVDKEVVKRGGEAFLLREIAWPIIDRMLTKEQQAIEVPRASGIGSDSMGSIVRFYVGFLTRELKKYEVLGKGYFRAFSEEEVSEEAVIVEDIGSEDEEVNEVEGWVYAFTFPSIKKATGDFPIKVGRTSGNVDERIESQTKGSAAFEKAEILGSWKVKRTTYVELAIHNVLKARDKWREQAPGKEWFDTTRGEIESIIKFVGGA